MDAPTAPSRLQALHEELAEVEWFGRTEGRARRPSPTRAEDDERELLRPVIGAVYQGSRLRPIVGGRLRPRRVAGA